MSYDVVTPYRYTDDPPCKVRINEEKVAHQFHCMSLCADKEPSTMNETTNSSNSVSAMWARFHELENQYVA